MNSEIQKWKGNYLPRLIVDSNPRQVHQAPTIQVLGATSESKAEAGTNRPVVTPARRAPLSASDERNTVPLAPQSFNLASSPHEMTVKTWCETRRCNGRFPTTGSLLFAKIHNTVSCKESSATKRGADTCYCLCGWMYLIYESFLILFLFSDLFLLHFCPDSTLSPFACAPSSYSIYINISFFCN